MSNVRVTWKLPTTRVNGKPLLATDIVSTIVSLSADSGAHFAELARVPAPVVTFLQTELEPGTYVFRLSVVDKGGLLSAGVDGTVTIAQVAPSTVTDVTVVVE